MLELNGKRIIVTFLMQLGDVVLTTPFIHALRNAAPDSHITYLADKKVADVVRNNPNLDEVLTIDKKGRDKSIQGLIRYAQKISRGKFDLLINLHPNERCSFLDSVAEVPLKMGCSHFLFRPFFTQVTPLKRNLHAAEMYLDVLGQLGVQDLSNNGLEIFPDDRAVLAAEKFWREQGVDYEDVVVGLNIGSAVEAKRWPVERFAALADLLTEQGARIVYFGGTAERELVEQAKALMHTQPVTATGAFSIAELAAAVGRCKIFITNDSGPMHIAVSRKVPVIALYGPSHPELYGPYTDNAVVLTAEPPPGGAGANHERSC